MSPVSLVNLKSFMHNTEYFSPEYRMRKEFKEIIILINQKLGAHK